MRELPILFSGPMVRAILAGTKTQTRRIIKETLPPEPAMDAINPRNTARHPAPYLDSYCGGKKTEANPRGMTNEWAWWTRDDRPGRLFKVRWVPGDRLWVKEKAAVRYNGDHHINGSSHGITYAADCSEHIRKGQAPSVFPRETFNKDGSLRWHSAMFMPRWASRITLDVTNVRVERLQAISEADAVAEGCAAVVSKPWWQGYRDLGHGGPLLHQTQAGDQPPAWMIDPRPADSGKWQDRSAVDAYRELWNHIDGPDAWDDNPWVAAVSFHRIANPEAAPAFAGVA